VLWRRSDRPVRNGPYLSGPLGQAEATGADAGQPGLERGHRTLIISTKGGQVVTIPLAPAPPGRSTWPAASARAVRLPDAYGRQLDHHARERIVRRAGVVDNDAMRAAA
jgi:hypothetical protein